MTRPSHIWLILAGCFAVLLSALGWISFTALRLDRLQQEAQQQAEVEEQVRLALWRIDSSLGPLMIEESARPASAYEAFGAARRAYTKGLTAIQQGDVLVPSPLLTFSSSNVLLHFQFGPDRPLTSPQVPEGDERKLARSGYVSPQQLRHASNRLAQFKVLLEQPVSPASLPAGNSRFGSLRTAAAPALRNGDVLIHSATTATNLPPADNSVADTQSQMAQMIQQPSVQPPDKKGQSFKSQAELTARANVYNAAQQRVAINNNMAANTIQAATPRVMEGLFTPVWLGDQLVLARRVETGAGFVIQGCWLNWTHLKQSLLLGIRDLLPNADLEPAVVNGPQQARMLAALPAKLVTRSVPSNPLTFWTPVAVSLAVAWVCVLFAGVAAVFLVHGILSLSERRAAFVSAVTHELRTPLTTFKMYSEMLAEEMVPDAAQRKHYLATLCSEANRLGHLVENVLAYARLERGSARSRVERTSLGSLIEKVKPRLEQRASQVGLAVCVDCDARALGTLVHVDVSVVEQILFNLVDNACKYAAPTATEKIIHLEALSEGKFAMLRVRDHGQGISAAGAKRLFQPFSKSAHEAAHTAPGVGLGLALCRRLSRSMGGDLRLDTLVTNGACFVLTLPLSQTTDAAAPV
jgi:signal transduction histidine kinase